MMRARNKIRYLCALSIALLCGCVEEINLATHEDLPYVVICVLSDTEEQTLDLYKPRYADQPEYTPVQNASITLNDQGHDQIVATFHFNGEKWSCKYTPEYGHTYKISIEIPGEPTITAITRMPRNIRLYGFANYKEGYKGSGLESVFYQFRIEERIKGWPYDRDTNYRYKGKCNVWLYPVNEYAPVVDTCISYNNFVVSDHIYADRFNINGNNAKYMVENDVMDDDEKYQWLKKALPGLPVFNKFIHIRHPASYDNKSDDMPHQSCFRLATENFQTYVTDLSLIGLAGGIARVKIDAWIFRSFYVSDELDEFYRYLYIHNLDRENITTVFRNDNAYTNIKGGIGIFGAEINNISKGKVWSKDYYSN